MRKFMIAGAVAALAVAAGVVGAPAADKLKVGFVYLGPVGDFGWTYQHEVGRQAVVKHFGDKVETSYLENVNEGPDSERAIDAYRNIVDLDDTNIAALDALAKLYDKLGDAAQSIDYMTRVAATGEGAPGPTSRPPDKVPA